MSDKNRMSPGSLEHLKRRLQETERNVDLLLRHVSPTSEIGRYCWKAKDAIKAARLAETRAEVGSLVNEADRWTLLAVEAADKTSGKGSVN